MRRVAAGLVALLGLTSPVAAQRPTAGEKVSVTTVLIDPRIARDSGVPAATDAILDLLRVYPTLEWIELCNWSPFISCKDFEADGDAIARDKLEAFLSDQVRTASPDAVPAVHELDERFFEPIYRGERAFPKMARNIQGTGRRLTYRVAIVARPDVLLTQHQGLRSLADGPATDSCFGMRQGDGRLLRWTAPPESAAALRLLLVLQPARVELSPPDFLGWAERTQRVFGHLAGAPSAPNTSGGWLYEGQRALQCPTRPQPSASGIQSFPYRSNGGRCFVDVGERIERPRLSCGDQPIVESRRLPPPSPEPPKARQDQPPTPGSPTDGLNGRPPFSANPHVDPIPSPPPTPGPTPPVPSARRDPSQPRPPGPPAPPRTDTRLNLPPPVSTGLRSTVHFEGTITIEPTMIGAGNSGWVSGRENGFRVVQVGNEPILRVQSTATNGADCPSRPKLQGRLTLPSAGVAYEIDVVLLLCPVDGERVIRLPPPPA